MKSIPSVQSMQAYSPPLENRRAFDGLLLDFNERMTSPSPKVIAALQNFFTSDFLPTYPEYDTLNTAIANYAQVSKLQILATNGSDRGIDIIFRTFSEKNDSVIIPKPSFAIFDQSAGIIGNKIISPSYNPDLTFPTEQVIANINSETKIIVICNPNNPTGTLASLSDIEKIIQAAPNSIVYIDEAYYEFAGLTAIPFIEKYSNVIVSRTFSKAFGLAALRIGYLVSTPELIAEMNKVRGPYEINIPATIAAQAALTDLDSMTSYVDEVMKSAKPLVEEFFQTNQIEYFPSSANYILFRPNNPEKLNQYLIENGIRLRPRSGPNIDNTLRVSIGTTEQMQRFISIYKNFLTQV